VSASPQHTYAQAGTYPVSVTLTTASGCSTVLTQNVTVLSTGIVGPSSSEESRVQVHGSNLEIFIPAIGNELVEVTVYDVLGRIIIPARVYSSGTITIQLPAGCPAVLNVRLSRSVKSELRRVVMLK
jgi:hypothetical protein